MIRQTFELHSTTGETWIAFTHCTCGTSVTGEDYDPAIALHVAEAEYRKHLALAQPGNRCAPRVGVRCYCMGCNKHAAQLAEMVAR